VICRRDRAAFFDTEGRRIDPIRAHQQQVRSVAAASRLGRQLEEVIASLSKVDARFALIGGLALASHKVIRATQDIDLLTDSEKAEDIDRELVAIGYQCLHRSPDAGNYLRGDERVDFIYASRPAARRLLEHAKRSKPHSAKCASSDSHLPPMAGITHVPAATSRDPFEALDDLMTVIEALCPVWPKREMFSSTDRFLI
jgi:hypothetical protein